MRKRKTKKRKKGIPAALKPWTDHLAKVRRANPGKSLKECMQIAKRTYKK